MTVATLNSPRALFGRAWSAVLAAWGAFIGILPHVLHHVGPLAGAALLAGYAGKAVFAAVGFAAAVPFLLRLHRRFRTWIAPATALAIFVLMFSLSSFVIAPLITGGEGATTRPGIEQPSGHASHHSPPK